MGYDRLGSNEAGSSRHEPPLNLHDDATSRSTSSPTPRLKKLLLLFSLIFLVASAVSVAVRFGLRTSASDESNAPIRSKPTIAISRTCSKTRYPTLCVDSLLGFPGAVTAGERDLVHISVNVTLHRFGKALYLSSEISNVAMNPHVRSAYLDCIELLDDSVDQLARSLTTPESTQDVLTWLSAALTNQDTCTEGLADVRGYVKYKMEQQLRDLAKLVSNCLAIYAAAGGNRDFYGIPIQNRRRRMLEAPEHAHRFPKWLNRRDRVLLNMPVAAIQADIVVAKDGNGTYKTIAEAIKSVPDYNTRRTIIYVKAGRYEEDYLKVGRKKTNLMFIGDGKGITIISGGKSVADNITTFRTASFAASGSGFIARDMTFENWAGPSKHQAVALRVGADHAVVYRCNIIGYQDTLYVHSQRQFFRECDIYGTVDFIFGNAAVVFQNCSIFARKPMAFQKNTITAQNRKDPNQNTGISIHACRILATSDLEASKGIFSTYLGRPWKLYSRTVFLLSYIGDHVHPRGWLEWNATFALDTLYYGEYMNYGPGSAVGQRVKWPGYRVINSTVEASKFTVAQFIFGSSWLPSTGVAYLAGLSV
ncbi:probable pectinesterase/pectinesterase inhibitor 34 [Rhododendron vialii]|uniref:probable pectinesterase/pectinesterase inhibitor 34 n=1 Tax=Rhododendron vialii TaxID=182163 RepID=UPI00265FF9B2|nr:probable pectinesterase/pectinesterase inhibitor 34 [Rhododendron vialii]